MTITGTNSNDVLIGTAGGDVIQGLAGHDDLQGLAGNDTLNGGDGFDTLNGGLGDDVLTGGGFADWFRFTAEQVIDPVTGQPALHGFGHDTISDFSAGDQLEVDFSAIPGGLSYNGFQIVGDDTILLSSIITINWHKILAIKMACEKDIGHHDRGKTQLQRLRQVNSWAILEGTMSYLIDAYIESNQQLFKTVAEVVDFIVEQYFAMLHELPPCGLKEFIYVKDASFLLKASCHQYSSVRQTAWKYLKRCCDEAPYILSLTPVLRTYLDILSEISLNC